MPIKTIITEKGSPRQHAKELRRARKIAYAEAAEYWHRRLLPKHFTTGAEERYGYQPRTEGYKYRKARAKGHTRPLVWSGETRRMVMRSASISTTAKGATVKMRGPKYLYAYHKNRWEPHKAEELTFTTKGEIHRMGQLVDRKVTRHLNALRAVRTTVIK